MKEKILSALSAASDEVIFLQQSMTRFPAFGPNEGGIGEFHKAEWIEKLVRSWGVNAIEHYDAADERVPSKIRPNMVIRHKGKSEKTLWIVGHMDVVPPGNESLWKTSPFEAVLDEDDSDIIRGRGVEDNQQAIVSGLLILHELVKNSYEPDLSFALLLVSDEETRNTFGINHVLKENPNLIKKDDLVLVPDFGTKEGNLIEIGEKGVLWLKIEIEGRQCHGSTPDEGINAFVAMSDMVLQIKKIEDFFTERNELFSPTRTTIVPTRHTENVPNINTIPGKEIFYLDCRILPEHDTQTVIGKVRELSTEIERKHSVSIQISVDNLEESSPETNADAEVVQKLKKAIFETYGLMCKTGGVGGATVGCKIRSLGIPVAVWSSAIPNYHQPNEGSRISNAIGDAKAFARLLFN